jgi:hypothetical protein
MNSFNSVKNNINVLNAAYGTFARREEFKPFLLLSGYYRANVTLYNRNDTIFTTLTNAAAGLEDIFIAKYDVAGIGIWATRISSTSTDLPVNMILDSTNNVYISGYYRANVTLYNSSGTSFTTLTNVASSDDIFIAKYNGAGIGIWATRISSNVTDQPVNMILDSTNNVYISGYYRANVTLYNRNDTIFTTLTNAAAGSEDIFIAKYNMDGSGIWATRISSTGTDRPVNMILDSTNNVYISGNYNTNVTLYNSSGTSFTTLTNVGGIDTFIAKYNMDGSGIWATRIAGTGNDQPVNMILDSTNNVYISGVYSANVTLYNSSGTNFTTLTNAAAGSFDTFIAKYDGAGIQIWATRISSTSADQPVNMILDSTNNVYISGVYRANVTLYNSNGTSFTTLTNNFTGFSTNIFIAKYNMDGSGIWATRISGSDTDIPVNMILDSTNNVYISGNYNTNVTLYNSSGTSFTTLTNVGGSFDTFIAKYDVAGIIIWATRISSNGTDRPVNMILDSTNNVYISGHYSTFSSTKVTLYNSSGTSFTTLTNAATGSADTFIAKYDGDGIGIWATRISSNVIDQPVNMILKKKNN